MPTFFQAGIIAGMLQGVYEGNMTFETLTQHGDIGLGTLNGVDGEMVAIEGNFYRIDAAGVASLIDPKAMTPFSVVTKFKPALTFNISNVNSIAALNELLDSHLPTKNIFYMFRIDAEIEWIRLRSEKCQTEAHKALAETLPKLQNIFELTNCRGSLIATRCPEYSAGFTIPNYHYHFIDQERKTGGHVFDAKLKSAKVMVTFMRRFSVALYENEYFDSINLNMDTQSALKKTE